MKKHTPGPWEVEYCPKTGRPLGIYAPNDAGIPGAVGHIVRARGIGLPSSEMAQANARLIAAAPELLEAAQALVDMAPTDGLSHRCYFCDESVYGSEDVGEHSPDCDYLKAKNAIAKAIP